jgi:sensor histidine kinase YesM
MLLTPVVLWLARRFPLTKSNLRQTIPIHLGASIAIALVQKLSHSTVVALYRTFADGYQLNWNDLSSALISYFDYGIPLYWIIILLNYAFDYYSRYKENEIKAAQLESQLAQAQLQALKMQLHPHFLFNTLNAISVLIQNNPELARRTVGRLSELLRYTLDNVGVQKVSLEEELEFLDRYLQIEQTRFGDRLTVKMEVDDALKNASVPNMILQPLVENAIKHGISKKRGQAVIEVQAHRDNGSLTLSVKDNGMGLPEEFTDNSAQRDGVGLASTRARLRELYGDAQSFELCAQPSGGAQAKVTIPYE